MVKVKVISVKDILGKLIFGLALILIIYLLISFLLKFLRTESKSFAASIVEESISSNVIFAKGNLNTRILKNELKIEEKIVGKVIENEKKSEISEPVNKIEEKNVKVVTDEQYLTIDEVKIWDRPKIYNVTELSSGKIQVGNCFITNYSNLELDKDELSKVSDFKINDDTSVLIFHTHTSEAYNEMGIDTNFRTTDDLYNIVSVGNVLKENLFLRKIETLHCTKKHDTPSYNGAYKASLKSVEDILKNKKYDLVIDLHRDALSGNINFRPTAEINGESAAKLMFVVGTNASGLSHEKWMENLKLALLIQNTANEMYPGLFRDLNLSKSRYNQQVSNGALIVEVGATGNTLDEAKIAMKYLSNVLNTLKN